MKKSHQVISTMVGAVIALAAAYELHSLIHDTSADRPVIWGVFGIFALGVFLMLPDLVGRFAKTVIVFVPKLSFGSRQEDVPMAAAPKGTKPGAPVVTDPDTIVIAKPKADPAPGDA